MLNYVTAAMSHAHAREFAVSVSVIMLTAGISQPVVFLMMQRELTIDLLNILHGLLWRIKYKDSWHDKKNCIRWPDRC